MAFKRALILGGAILLAAGCSSSVTAPVAKVDGGAASSTKATNPPAKRPFGAAATEGMASDSTSCRGNYPVPSGFADSTCTIEQ